LRLALHYYKKSAKDRGLEFSLTEDEFSNLTQQDCVYCGEAPDIETTPYKRKELSSLIPMNGIDRINSGDGYVTGNCAPCCSKCNQIKMDMSVFDFMRHISKIYKHNFDM
jgi:hypothetical protein